MGEGCGVDVFGSTVAAPLPVGGEGLLLSSSSESPWDDSPSIEESSLPLFWTGILHVLMFIQVSVGSSLQELAPSIGGLILQAF